MKIVPVFFVTFLVSLASTAPTRAQCTPHWGQFPLDTGFLAACVDDSGPDPSALYLGGIFRSMVGVPDANGILAWDGTEWSAVGGGVSGGSFARVNTMAMFDDDSSGPNASALYAGGIFTTAGGVSANGIAKWDGASWSPLGVGTDTWVNALIVFDDDALGPHPRALYAAGNFITAAGNGASAIAKWNGSSWSALGDGPSAEVHALAVFDDDAGGPNLPALYAAGAFDWAGAVNGNKIAKWDGTSWSPLGSGLGPWNSTANSLAVFDDDGAGPHAPALYVAGGFTSAGGVSVSGFAKWDGTSWSAVDSAASHAIRTFTVFDDDGSGPNAPALYAAGSDPVVEGVSTSVAKWDGTSWSGLGSGMNDVVQALTAFDVDGVGPEAPALHAGGFFTVADDLGAYAIAKWTGTTWSALSDDNGTGSEDPVRAMTVFDDDGSGPHAPALYAGGRFRIITQGAGPETRLAKWNGSTWTGLGLLPNDAVLSLLVFDADGAGPDLPALYAGGMFTTIGNVSANYVAKWNGSTWSALGSGLNGFVTAMAVFDDDGTGPNAPALFVGGTFSTAGGSSAVKVAKWDGSSWSALGSGIVGFVASMATFDADAGGANPAKLYVGGSFHEAGGVTTHWIAQWDGTSWSPVGGGTNGAVESMLVFDADGVGPNLPALYVGGSFTNAGGVGANRIAKWNGTSWSALGSGLFGGSLTEATALAIYDDDGAGPSPSALFVGGEFTNAGGIAASRIAKWDGSTWSALGAGVDGAVSSLAGFDEDVGGPTPSALYVGGDFSTAGQVDSSRIARWWGCGSTVTFFCAGDGSLAPCPCGNNGSAFRGCQNSAGTGGAVLSAIGNAGLSSDSLRLTSAGELPVPLSIFLQGTSAIAPAVYGDGLRCTGGALKRLYVRNAVGGVITAPSGSESPVSVRSAQLGDALSSGSPRYYQTYYRDPNAAYCPNPPGNTWNVSSGLVVIWSP